MKIRDKNSNLKQGENEMANKKIYFGEPQIKEFAIFVSQLEREGVTYDVDCQGSGWTVTLTGGY